MLYLENHRCEYHVKIVARTTFLPHLSVALLDIIAIVGLNSFSPVSLSLEDFNYTARDRNAKVKGLE